ncbi:MAG: pyridoxamine 5-phosphate oxidase [Pseudomonadales bacterium]|nr:pyridoxamine 5-phosphate oxidase [Pseudomonadales bacterium]
MTHEFAERMFTESVKLTQTHFGSREQNERLHRSFGPNDELTEKEAEFITGRDSFYLSTVSETGWPYVQHRSGPPGFLKVLDRQRIAYADFKGNTQLISTGNVATNDKCSLILMDYANRRRLKLLGHLQMHDVRAAPIPELELVVPSDYKAKVERVAIIQIVAFDWNCPQHITPRYTLAELEREDVLRESSPRP